MRKNKVQNDPERESLLGASSSPTHSISSTSPRTSYQAISPTINSFPSTSTSSTASTSGTRVGASKMPELPEMAGDGHLHSVGFEDTCEECEINFQKQVKDQPEIEKGRKRKKSWPDGWVPMNRVQKMSYSVGHVLNDLCSAVWFTYLLIYMEKVRELSSTMSGFVLLVGQVADGLATAFVGLEADRNIDWKVCSYGKRKLWHLFGTVCVVISFPAIFTECIGCQSDTRPYSKMIYYSSFIVLFQFGWAAVQIAHLSLIPVLTSCTNERVGLNASRYSWTVTSNITVYAITWFLLQTSDAQGDNITPADGYSFMWLALAVTCIGLVFSLIFHIFLKEVDGPVKPQVRNRSVSINSLDYSLAVNHLKWHNWFGVGQFYKVALLYMGTRLTINLTQAYVPFYLSNTLHLSRESIAYIPLLMYLCGFLSSFVMKKANKKWGKKIVYMIGCVISVIAFGSIHLGAYVMTPTYKTYGIYLVSAMLGISGSTMLITSLGITNDMIGHNTSSGSFVFGAMSFIDKVSNGVTVMVVQTFMENHVLSVTDEDFYRYVLVILCGGSTVLSLIALAALTREDLGARKARPKANSINTISSVVDNSTTN